MKLTKSKLKQIIKEVIAETDGYTNLIKTNKEVEHNWAVHVEWRSSTYANKYGNVVGEVIHHTLYEDGSITHYDVRFGNHIVKHIPADKLNVLTQESHKHETDEDPGDDEEWK